MNDFKLIPLTKGKSAIVDPEDFEWLSQWKWLCNAEKYVIRMVSSKNSDTGERKNSPVWMHREIMQPPPDVYVDHINRNPLDNRRLNLRFCTHRQNCQNQSPVKNTSSPYKGASLYRGKWRSYIRVNGNSYFLGSFASDVDAAKTYDAAARYYFGEFAATNFQGVEALSVEEIAVIRRVDRKSQTSSIYLGVSYQKRSGKWVPYVWLDRKLHSFPLCETEKQAALVRDRKLIEMNVPNPELNFPLKESCQM